GVIEGEVRNSDNYRDRFGEMSAPVRLRSDSTGHVDAALVEPRLKERDPQVMVRRTVQLSVTQRATVSLAVEPSRFAWHDSTGGPSGVQPMLLFAVVNHGDTPIRVFFSRNEVFCVHVQSLDPDLVDTAGAVSFKASIVAGPSSNGRTPDFGSGNEGSNPSGPIPTRHAPSPLLRKSIGPTSGFLPAVSRRNAPPHP